MNNNYPKSVEKIVNNYIDKLKEHMKGLPEEDKDDFVKEIQSHIYESYMNEKSEDEIDRIFNVLNKLGEPSEVFSKKMPDRIVKKGKEKNLPLYILSGILIGLFGIPLGITGIAMLISIIGTVFALIVAYFATAISLIVAGFVGTVVSIIRIFNPEFLDQFMRFIEIESVSYYFGSPLTEGILGIIVSLIVAGIGVVLLLLGRYIFRGLKFLTNVSVEKLKNFKKKS